MNLLQLTNINELYGAIRQSSTIPVFFFKHSTRCPISKTAESEYLSFADNNASNKNVVFTHLDLIKYRDISDAIATELGITHQSPQVILVINEVSVWSASHDDITQESLTEVLARNL